MSEATTGYRLKLAVVILLAAFISAFDIALAAVVLGMDGESGPLSAAALLLLLTVFATVIAIPVLVWQDARAVREAELWHPRPWFWALSPFLFYGIPVLVYLVLRYHHVGDLGRPLFGTEGTVAGPERPSQPVNAAIWGLRLKIALLVVLFTAVFVIAVPERATLLAFPFGVGYIAVTVSVWFDTRALRERGTWGADPWSWTILTFVLHCLPALPYLVLRSRHVDNTGASVVDWVTEAAGRSGTGDDLNRTLERADERLERADTLLEDGSVIEARDAYEDAQSAYEEARRLADTTPLESAPRVQHRIERAERGIETCWLRAFEDRLDTAEEDLAAGDHESARESFEQVRTALDRRTFEHRDTETLERRVVAGLRACSEEPTD